MGYEVVRSLYEVGAMGGASLEADPSAWLNARWDRGSRLKRTSLVDREVDRVPDKTGIVLDLPYAEKKGVTSHGTMRREAGKIRWCDRIGQHKSKAASDPPVLFSSPTILFPFSSPFTPTDPPVARASNAAFLPFPLFFTTPPSTYPRLADDNTNHLFPFSLTNL